MGRSSIILPTNKDSGTNFTNDQCVGYDGNSTPCEKATIQATIEQARDSDWQANAAAAGVFIGLVTMLAAISAAYFARQAAIYTARNVRATIRGSYHAKRSADIAESAFKAHERPLLQVEIVGFSPATRGQHELPQLTFKIRNYGRTPAILVSQQAMLSVVPNDTPTPKIEAENRDIWPQHGLIVGAGETSDEIECWHFHAATGAQMVDMFKSDFCTAFVGYIWYHGMSGPEYIKGFRFCYGPLRPKFGRPFGIRSCETGIEYEYEREITRGSVRS